MKKTVLLLVLCLCLPVWSLTIVTKVIDPDNAGGTDYTSLDAWEDALGGTTNGDLVTNDEIAIAECRASSGGNDTAPVDFLGWTTDSTRYIRVELHSDETNTGIFNAANYTLTRTDGTIINVREDYVQIDGIQFECTQTGANTARGIIYSQGRTVADNLLRVSNCIFKGVCSGTGGAQAIKIDHPDNIMKVWNCTFDDFFITSDTLFVAIEIDQAASVGIYNCTISHCTRGIWETGVGTYDVINCAIFDCEDDFVGTFNSIDYCATDQHAGGGTNGVNISTNWNTTCFTTPEATPPNFSVQDIDSPVYNTGNGATPKSDFTDDIIGTTRGPADLDWDIGAFEFVSAPAPSGQVITIIMTSIPLFLIPFFFIRKIRLKVK